MQQNMVILGSTGSIGQSTLAVIAQNPEQYRAFALVGGRNVEKMTEQCLKFKPNFVAMADPKACLILKENLRQLGLNIAVLSGEKAICEL